MLLPLLFSTSTNPTVSPTVLSVVDGGDAFRLILEDAAGVPLSVLLVPDGPAGAIPQAEETATLVSPTPETAGDLVDDGSIADTLPAFTAEIAALVVEVDRKPAMQKPVVEDIRVPPTLAQRMVVQMLNEVAVVAQTPPQGSAKPDASVVIPHGAPQQTVLALTGSSRLTSQVAGTAIAQSGKSPDLSALIAHTADPVIAPLPSVPFTSLPQLTSEIVNRISVAKGGFVLRDVMASTEDPADARAVSLFGADGLDPLFAAPLERVLTGATVRTVEQPTQTARHVAQQIAVSVTQSVGQPTEIALNPEELGRVRMSMASHEGALVVHIIAERPETTDLLRRHIDTLAQEFRNLGYSDISFDFGGDRANHPGNGNANPTPGHPDDVEEAPETPPTTTTRVTVGLDLRL
jgi:hypothetical protein